MPPLVAQTAASFCNYELALFTAAAASMCTATVPSAAAASVSN
jgi:hypothetical protein